MTPSETDGAIVGRELRSPDPDALRHEVDRAIVDVTGWGRTSFPHGSLAGLNPRIEPRVREVLVTLHSYEPDGTIDDAAELSQRARAHVAAAHPELSDDALDALAWLFSFEWR